MPKMADAILHDWLINGTDPPSAIVAAAGYGCFVDLRMIG